MYGFEQTPFRAIKANAEKTRVPNSHLSPLVIFRLQGSDFVPKYKRGPIRMEARYADGREKITATSLGRSPNLIPYPIR